MSNSEVAAQDSSMRILYLPPSSKESEGWRCRLLSEGPTQCSQGRLGRACWKREGHEDVPLKSR
eukprot:12573095-Prorocentrum_lima.AAC.1